MPQPLIGKTVDPRIGEKLLEVYYKGKLQAAHALAYKPGDFSTKPEHMPESYRRIWTVPRTNCSAAPT